VILPHLPPEELRSAYAAARVHALPSWIETCGLVTMEAALAGCSVVASTAGYELEYYRDHAYYCDPGDVGSIRAAVLAAYNHHAADARRRLELKRLILQEYTWERAAEAAFRAYCRVLACPSRARSGAE
jgi:glycosyltransferase involved in cell wall biosynthesis